MTEATTTTPMPVRPNETLLHLLVLLLAPMFLTTSDGDIAFARAAALETIKSYQINTNADLITIAQIIAYGLTALGSLGLSMAEDLSLSMTIRLRANAALMTRSAEQNRRALRESSSNTARSDRPETPFSEPDQAYEASVLASVAAARTSIAEGRVLMQTATPPAETSPILSAESGTGPTLLEQAPTMAQTPIKQTSIEKPLIGQISIEKPLIGRPQAGQSMTERQRQAMWVAAMIDVAGEYTAGLSNLPPAQRRVASMRAAALSTTAHNLIAGAVPPQAGFGALAPPARHNPA